MVPENWQPSGDELVSAIEKASRERRSDCWAFVAEFAEMYVVDRSARELDDAWVELVNEYPWYAEDLLHCLRSVLGQPGRPLPELVADIAALEAEDDPDYDARAYDRQASARRWLGALHVRFNVVFEALSGPPPATPG